MLELIKRHTASACSPLSTRRRQAEFSSHCAAGARASGGKLAPRWGLAESTTDSPHLLPHFWLENSSLARMNQGEGTKRDGEMPQSRTWMPCQCENQNWNARTETRKIWVWWHGLKIPALGRLRQGELWDLLASQIAYSASSRPVRDTISNQMQPNPTKNKQPNTPPNNIDNVCRTTDRD